MNEQELGIVVLAAREDGRALAGSLEATGCGSGGRRSDGDQASLQVRTMGSTLRLWVLCLHLRLLDAPTGQTRVHSIYLLGIRIAMIHANLVGQAIHEQQEEKQ